MTDRYAVFGNPIAHSMSPQIHAYFASLCGDDLEYGTVLVPAGEFAKQCDSFFSHGGRGCNVTVPCKLDACAYADELTPYAQSAGAVNTLKLQNDGKILGDNTDGRGFIADLKRLKLYPEGKRILLIGAGGAAKGIMHPLLEEKPAAVTVVNRNMDKAVELAKAYGKEVTVCRYDELKAEYDLVINATSSSLNGALPPLEDEVLRAASAAYDLMYKKDGVTTFTQHAIELGVTDCHDGFGMLIMQAALSYELWRGVRPDAGKAIAHFR